MKKNWNTRNDVRAVEFKSSDALLAEWVVKQADGLPVVIEELLKIAQSYWREAVALEIEAEHSPKPTLSGVSNDCWREDFTRSRVQYDEICSHLEDATVARTRKRK